MISVWNMMIHGSIRPARNLPLAQVTDTQPLSQWDQLVRLFRNQRFVTQIASKISSRRHNRCPHALAPS